MIATGRENTFPPNVVTRAHPSNGHEDLSTYVSEIIDRLREVHQRVALTAALARPNPYQQGSLIWVSTPTLERTSLLSLNG